MIAVITGDIKDSRKLKDQQLWVEPLKRILNTCGATPKYWEIYRGDSFQMQLDDPAEAMKKAIQIKAAVKTVRGTNTRQRNSIIDARMAIGLGSKDYDAPRITESNGEAFVFSGRLFERLEAEKTSLAIQSPWPEFDKDINLMLKLALVAINDWSIYSGELAAAVLEHPNMKQSLLGEQLGIEQNSVSGRYKRAHMDEIQELEQMYRLKLSKYLL